MNRRLFITGLGGALVGSSSLRIAAQCINIAPGTYGCRVGLGRHFKIVTQDCPERCYAASIAGIFGFHGHKINQDVIAQTVFGTLACKASGGPKVLNAILNHKWTDDDGDEFTATITGLYDPLSNTPPDLDNDDAVSQLKDQKPLLYCNRSHAMVVIGIDYRRNGAGDLLAVDQVHVADPFPGLGFHVLSAKEMVPMEHGGDLTYLASIDVDD